MLSGAGARLQRALIAWMLDLHIRQGYLEKYTPFMVRQETLFAAGQLPKFRDNLYHDAEEDLWMVPTAEVPLTGLHMDEILDGGTLPRCATRPTRPASGARRCRPGATCAASSAVTSSTRSRCTSSAPRRTRRPSCERMRAHAEQTCAVLGFAYRIKQLCAGDLGFAARKTYDIEVWAPGCGEWLEVSSVSNCGDFQARRANVRYRPELGPSPQYVHTLNGSGLGLPRTLIAVLENYQQADGSVVVPPVLRPWMGGIELMRRPGPDA